MQIIQSKCACNMKSAIHNICNMLISDCNMSDAICKIQNAIFGADYNKVSTLGNSLRAASEKGLDMHLYRFV